MDRLVATTFKILFLSLMFMFLLDTTLLLTEIISVHSSISNVSGLIQTEVARNNCLPYEMANGFKEYLQSIAKDSRVMDGDAVASDTFMNSSDIKTNFFEDLKIGTETYGNLTEGNVKNYGEITTVAVEVKMHPAFIYIGNTVASTQRRSPFDVTVDYVYKVPCLRYLK